VIELAIDSITTPWAALGLPGEPGDDDDAARGRILDGALERFLAHGIRPTTMTQVAGAAGLGVATVYRRYPRKQQLIQAVLLREVRRFIAEVDARTAAATTPEEQTVEGFVAFVTGIASRPLLLVALRDDPELGLPMLTEHGAPVLALGRGFIAATIRRWQREGTLAAFDADLVAEIFARLAHSLVLTPEGLIPTGDDATTRAFARTYLLPLLRPRLAPKARLTIT
jgi:AcrR family transcriptional regulator